MTQIAEKKNTKLYELLVALCEKVIEKILEHKAQNELITIPYRYLPVREVDYTMETFYYDWDKVEYFDSYDWKGQDFVNFLDTELKAIPEFEVAATELATEFKFDIDIIQRIGLSQFLSLFMKQVPNDKIKVENIDYYVKLLINDYSSFETHTPTNWNIHLWLQNIIIETDEIEIAPNVFLRRPTKEQLANISIRNYHTSEFDQMTGRGLVFGAILSFSVSIKAEKKASSGMYPEKVIRAIESWLNILRLFKPCSVIPIYQTAIPSSIFEYEVSENIEQPFDKFWKGKIEYIDTSSYKLYLRKEDEELLRAFIPIVQPILNGISHKTYLSGSSYDLALHRYNDSLIKSEVNAYRILSAITSLESLLSDGSEITFKIGLRVTKLISYFGFEPSETLSKMKIAYNLRSKLVHGTKLKMEDKDEKKKIDLLEWARNHTHEIINFNRICLLIALQLKNDTGKDDLTRIIDNSFISSKADEELKKKIEERVRIPVANPFRKNETEHK